MRLLRFAALTALTTLTTLTSILSISTAGCADPDPEVTGSRAYDVEQ